MAGVTVAMRKVYRENFATRDKGRDEGRNRGLEITTTCPASGRAVIRFNSDLISGRCAHAKGNVSDIDASPLLPVSTRPSRTPPFFYTPPSLLRDLHSAQTPLDAAIVAPRTPTHTRARVRGGCTYTYARWCGARLTAVRTDRASATCASRTSTMMSEEFAPGGTRMYAKHRTLHRPEGRCEFLMSSRKYTCI